MAAYDPLKGQLIDGQNLPWNALADLTDAGGKAYGPRMQRALASIRADIVWWLNERKPGVMTEEPLRPAQFEAALASTITVVARRLIHESSPGLTWGPEGIARNFRRGLMLIEGRSTDEIAAIVADVEGRS